MSDAIKSLFVGRAGAWWTLIIYCLADAALVTGAWLQSAPDAVSQVGWKGWCMLLTIVIASLCKTVRCVMSGDWKESAK